MSRNLDTQFRQGSNTSSSGRLMKRMLQRVFAQLEARMKVTNQQFGVWKQTLADGTEMWLTVNFNGPVPVRRSFVVSKPEEGSSILALPIDFLGVCPAPEQKLLITLAESEWTCQETPKEWGGFYWVNRNASIAINWSRCSTSTTWFECENYLAWSPTYLLAVNTGAAWVYVNGKRLPFTLALAGIGALDPENTGLAESGETIKWVIYANYRSFNQNTRFYARRLSIAEDGTLSYVDGSWILIGTTDTIKIRQNWSFSPDGMRAVTIGARTVSSVEYEGIYEAVFSINAENFEETPTVEFLPVEGEVRTLLQRSGSCSVVKPSVPSPIEGEKYWKCESDMETSWQAQDTLAFTDSFGFNYYNCAAVTANRTASYSTSSGEYGITVQHTVPVPIRLPVAVGFDQKGSRNLYSLYVKNFDSKSSCSFSASFSCSISTEVNNATGTWTGGTANVEFSGVLVNTNSTSGTVTGNLTANLNLQVELQVQLGEMAEHTKIIDVISENVNVVDFSGTGSYTQTDTSTWKPSPVANVGYDPPLGVEQVRESRDPMGYYIWPDFFMTFIDAGVERDTVDRAWAPLGSVDCGIREGDIYFEIIDPETFVTNWVKENAAPGINGRYKTQINSGLDSALAPQLTLNTINIIDPAARLCVIEQFKGTITELAPVTNSGKSWLVLHYTHPFVVANAGRAVTTPAGIWESTINPRRDNDVLVFKGTQEVSNAFNIDPLTLPSNYPEYPKWLVLRDSDSTLNGGIPKLPIEWVGPPPVGAGIDVSWDNLNDIQFSGEEKDSEINLVQIACNGRTINSGMAAVGGYISNINDFAGLMTINFLEDSTTVRNALVKETGSFPIGFACTCDEAFNLLSRG